MKLAPVFVIFGKQYPERPNFIKYLTYAIKRRAYIVYFALAEITYYNNNNNNRCTYNAHIARH